MTVIVRDELSPTEAAGFPREFAARVAEIVRPLPPPPSPTYQTWPSRLDPPRTGDAPWSHISTTGNLN